MWLSFWTRTGLLVNEFGPALLTDITIAGFTWHCSLLLFAAQAQDHARDEPRGVSVVPEGQGYGAIGPKGARRQRASSRSGGHYM
jgi:hypothetical protein